MKHVFLIALLHYGWWFYGQQQPSTKVILITMDGLRWQELFTGADMDLITNEKYTNHPELLKADLWRDTAEERRLALFPFIWNDAVNMGQLYGNRNIGNSMNLTNTMWFSYPGYNEILTGKADDARIRSNDKVPNPNTTLLEAYQNKRNREGAVAAFGSWDVFPYIINEERSGVPVNAGFETASGNLSDREVFLNELQGQVPSPWKEVRLDAFTHHYALEYMKKVHPDFVYIAYGETDDFAHAGNYEAYLNAARNTDDLLRDVWEFTQKDDFYHNRTVFLVTTDHGRGTQPLDTWTGHGSEVEGSDQVWMLVFGVGVEPLGEVSSTSQLYSSQIAPTLAKILGMEWEGNTLNLKEQR
ncbi:alkaline phosphatase family protein [Robertkochia flava]|uniref:phosphoglyceromutase n=1 Tax=Robertkochia flava TaxID=3447986 RepID=UPI001CCA137C|nr:phosphoglyceromutase [Robertkochia marina]